MKKPRVFIGSSSEGLPVAEAIFACMSRETDPTLWTHQIFTPGAYPLEALEQALRSNSFAVLVASPDDQLLKRGVSAAVMRDNLLLEFGLFAGALGRTRVFFVCPDEPKLDLPSDLFGVVTATYSSERVRISVPDRAAAVQTACQQIRDNIREQWSLLQQKELQAQALLLASKQSQAIRRLHSVATVLRDALMTLQRDSFAAFTDKNAFDAVKRRSADEVRKIASEYRTDAQSIGVHQQLECLTSTTHAALVDLPFPQELADGTQAIGQTALDIGRGALDTFLRGGDAVGHVRRAAEQEAGGKFTSLSRRYGEWWARHSPQMQESAAAMQDALFNAMVAISAEQLGRAPH